MKPYDKTSQEESGRGLGLRTETRGDKPVVTVDYEFYERFLEDTNLTEEQKREFLQHLWNLICEFVSLGWGVHPLQQAQEGTENCGKSAESKTDSANADADALHCLDSIFIEKFSAATEPEEDRSGEGVQT
ncbi:MAG: hypothetical protein RIM72_11260 [Alphaproteobacteria bacterium]